MGRARARAQRATTEAPRTAGIRLILADGLTMFAAAVRSVLEQAGFDVVHARTGGELLAAARARTANVALVDVRLPPTGGVDAIRVLSRDVGTPAVAWDADPRPGTIIEAIRANAIGYLPKRVAPATLVDTVRAASRGEATAPPVLTAEIADELHRASRRRRAKALLAALSGRELEVLALTARGNRNREIGRALAISEFTVKRHMHNILEKLGLDSRRDAAALYDEARGTDTSGVDFGAQERTCGSVG